ncbi:hypothetical protein CDAR_461521 [Caerostris darwini]|uniref:Uncharacterized protein n=1 Tax=Caerostris darwini TaxID=1538125 RepID=A0AAV4M5C4_9ARAC|nr:hypothetical protein CDAR_461521 [Caerostris darwini]
MHANREVGNRLANFTLILEECSCVSQILSLLHVYFSSLYSRDVFGRKIGDVIFVCKRSCQSVRLLDTSHSAFGEGITTSTYTLLRPKKRNCHLNS